MFKVKLLNLVVCAASAAAFASPDDFATEAYVDYKDVLATNKVYDALNQKIDGKVDMPQPWIPIYHVATKTTNGVEWTAQRHSLDTNAVNSLISIYDVTNLTPRIDARILMPSNAVPVGRVLSKSANGVEWIENKSVDTNNVNSLISIYDATNLTPRIDARIIMPSNTVPVGHVLSKSTDGVEWIENASVDTNVVTDLIAIYDVTNLTPRIESRILMPSDTVPVGRVLSKSTNGVEWIFFQGGGGNLGSLTLVKDHTNGWHAVRAELNPAMQMVLSVDQSVSTNRLMTIEEERDRAIAAELENHSLITNEIVRATESEESLSDRIKAISSVGRFLSTWDCRTGRPGTEPKESPMPYVGGDYYLVASVASSGSQYMPSGTVYTNGSTSTATTTDLVNVNDLFRHTDDGGWVHVSMSGVATTFALLAGEPRENVKLEAELDKSATNLLGMVVSETNRATAAESSLRSSVSNETRRAYAVETNLLSRIESETNRAQTAETAIASQLQGVPHTVSNVVTRSYVEGLGISAGLATNDVQGIIDTNVATNSLASRSWVSSTMLPRDGTKVMTGPLTIMAQNAGVGLGTSGRLFFCSAADESGYEFRRYQSYEVCDTSKLKPDGSMIATSNVVEEIVARHGGGGGVSHQVVTNIASSASVTNAGAVAAAGSMLADKRDRLDYVWWKKTVNSFYGTWSMEPFTPIEFDYEIYEDVIAVWRGFPFAIVYDENEHAWLLGDYDLEREIPYATAEGSERDLNVTFSFAYEGTPCTLTCHRDAVETFVNDGLIASSNLVETLIEQHGGGGGGGNTFVFGVTEDSEVEILGMNIIVANLRAVTYDQIEQAYFEGKPMFANLYNIRSYDGTTTNSCMTRCQGPGKVTLAGSYEVYAYLFNAVKTDGVRNTELSLVVFDFDGNTIAILMHRTEANVTAIKVGDITYNPDWGSENGMVTLPKYQVVEEDRNGSDTAVTIGWRDSGLVGANSLCVGRNNRATGTDSIAMGMYSYAYDNSFAWGVGCNANNNNTIVLGKYVNASDANAFVWNGGNVSGNYASHGTGTFNVKVNGGMSGFFIGETNLVQLVLNVTHPVNSVWVQYTSDDNPNTLFNGVGFSSTWTDVTDQFNKRYFMAASGYEPNTEQEESLPNIKGSFTAVSMKNGSSESPSCQLSQMLPPFSSSANLDYKTRWGMDYADTSVAMASQKITFDAHDADSTYSDNADVKPLTSTVKVWKRTN